MIPKDSGKQKGHIFLIKDWLKINLQEMERKT